MSAREGVPFGPFRLLKKLATSAQAEVFLARGAEGGGWVVLKRLLPALKQTPQSVRRFLDEARIAAQLRHPHVVRVEGLGEIDGWVYLTMEHVDGVDLGHLAEAVAAAHRRVPWPVAVRIGVQLCEALEYIHGARALDGRPLKLVHRDVHPGNVMLGREGNVKLLDFGIAVAETSPRPGGHGVDAALEYAAPEVLNQQTVDVRTDLYGVGVVLYELLCGANPFRRESPAKTAQAVLNERPQKLQALRRDVPKALSVALDAALMKPPARRPADAKTLRAVLERTLYAEDEVVGLAEVSAFLETIFPHPGHVNVPSAGPEDVTVRSQEKPGGPRSTARLSRSGTGSSGGRRS